MGRRLELHSLLTAALGSNHAYFQPPENVVMQFPCIIYNRDSARTEFADNYPYSFKQKYQVTVVDRNPDSDIPARVAALASSTLNRTFVADGLHHDVFTLYF